MCLLFAFYWIISGKRCYKIETFTKDFRSTGELARAKFYMLHNRNENTILRLLKMKNLSSLETDKTVVKIHMHCTVFKTRLHSFYTVFSIGKYFRSLLWLHIWLYPCQVLRSHIVSLWIQMCTGMRLPKLCVFIHPQICWTLAGLCEFWHQLRCMACGRSQGLSEWWYGNGSEALIQIWSEAHSRATTSLNYIRKQLECKSLKILIQIILICC